MPLKKGAEVPSVALMTWGRGDLVIDTGQSTAGLERARGRKLQWSMPASNQTYSMLPFLDGATLRSLIDPISLVKALEQGFAAEVSAPPRTHVSLASDRPSPDTLLMMPAWNEDVLGIKLATIHPGNGNINLPAVHASYVLKNRHTGEDLALMDGIVLTQLRTAATSALASSMLSREDATCLLMVGAGSLALPLIEAHCAVRSISRILVWNRSKNRAARLASSCSMPVTVVEDLASACIEADVISCATLSTEALICGANVRPGTHVDLVGAYRSDMRESDTSLIRQSSVFVDTFEGAQQEAGDLLLASTESDWSFDRIEADLATLCQQHHAGRGTPDQITVFKSVGASLQDLIAASLAWKRYSA